MIVLDASVLIAHLDPSDAHHDRATALLDAHRAEPFLMSVVTRAEILVGPARSGMLDEVQRALDRLGIVTTALRPDGAEEALARLRADTRLRLPDCCVLLESERSRAGVATFDAELAAAVRARGGRVVG